MTELMECKISWLLEYICLLVYAQFPVALVKGFTQGMGDAP